MRVAVAVAVVVVVASAACARRESGVEPTLHVGYTYVEPGWGDERTTSEPVADRATVLVGMPIHVDGYFAATCSYPNTAAWTRDSTDPDKFPRHRDDCDREDTRVEVTCAGPCVVRGPFVTPTAPGELRVTIVLASRDSSRTLRTVRILRAVAPEEFEIWCGRERPHTSPGEPVLCETTEPAISVAMVAGGESFGVPLLVNGEAFAAARDFVTVSLARLFGYPPGTPFRPAPGIYRLELRYADVTRTVEINLDPPAPPATLPATPP